MKNYNLIADELLHNLESYLQNGSYDNTEWIYSDKEILSQGHEILAADFDVENFFLFLENAFRSSNLTPAEVRIYYLYFASVYYGICPLGLYLYLHDDMGVKLSYAEKWDWFGKDRVEQHKHLRFVIFTLHSFLKYENKEAKQIIEQQNI